MLGRGDLQSNEPMVISIQGVAVLCSLCLNRKLGCSLPPLSTVLPVAHHQVTWPSGSTQNSTWWPSSVPSPCQGWCSQLPAQSVATSWVWGLWSRYSPLTSGEVLSAASLAWSPGGLAALEGCESSWALLISSTSSLPVQLGLCLDLDLCGDRLPRLSFPPGYVLSSNCRVFVLLVAEHLHSLRPLAPLF